MTLSLYMDKGSLARSVIGELRRLGLDVLTTSEVGRDEAPDIEQLEFAASEGGAIYTSNVDDFASLHAQWLASERTHGGIVVRFHQRMPAGQQVQALLALSHEFRSLSFENQFEYLERWRPKR